MKRLLFFSFLFVVISCDNRSQEERVVDDILKAPNLADEIMRGVKSTKCYLDSNNNLTFWKKEIAKFKQNDYKLEPSNIQYDEKNNEFKTVNVKSLAEENIELEFLFRKIDKEWCLIGIGYKPQFDVSSTPRNPPK